MEGEFFVTSLHLADVRATVAGLYLLLDEFESFLTQQHLNAVRLRRSVLQIHLNRLRDHLQTRVTS